MFSQSSEQFTEFVRRRNSEINGYTECSLTGEETTFPFYLDSF